MTHLTVRAAAPADAAALGAIHVASWRESYVGLLPGARLAALPIDARTAMWRQLLADPTAFGDAAVFVAVRGGELAGFGACAAQRDPALAAAGFEGEVTALYVRHAHQRLGLGRALMHALARALEARGHGAASLWVLRDNAPARAFYERLGGETLGEKVDDRPEARLVETAYGWRDLAMLMR